MSRSSSCSNLSSFLRIFALVLCVCITVSACKGSSRKPQGSKASTKPVAEAKQAVETPTLGTPPGGAPAKAETPKAAATPETPAPATSGAPITLPTPPTPAPSEAAPGIPVTPQGGIGSAPTTVPAGPTTPMGPATPTPEPTLGSPPPVSPTLPATPGAPALATTPPAPTGPSALAQPPSATEAAVAKLPGTPEASLAAGGTAGALSAIAAPEIAPLESAAPAQAQEVKYEPKLVTSKTNVEVILDASGSMAAPFGTSTQSKFEVARDALFETIYDMGQSQADFPRNIAVRLFGSKQEASANDCEDTDLVIGMGEPNLDAIKSVLTKITPKGTSPIAYTLNEAGKDFPGGLAVDRVIVLVADGIDSCGNDPCTASAKLQEAETKTVIHVIAFDVAADEAPKLECISKSSEGLFLQARNDVELTQALEQAINSTVPYNLKLVVSAGGTVPIPFKVVVFKAGTEEVVRRGDGTGTKLLNLAPGMYDILVEYDKSPETRKPSKILKGVEVLATTRLEQAINFDLGQLTLSAVSSDGKPTAARFKILKNDGTTVVATLEGGPEPQTVFLPFDSYQIMADPVEGQAESFTLQENNIPVKAQESVDLAFKFQKGTLALKGLTTLKAPLPFIFEAYKASDQTLVASGALPAEGGSVMLPPGDYDLIVTGIDPNMMVSPRTKISGVTVKAGETAELVAMFEMGTLTVTAFDGKGNRVPADFVVQDPETKGEITRISSPSGNAVSTSLPPGTYNVVAYSTKSILEPKPSVTLENVTITANQPTEQSIQFVLGTLRLLGRNVKETPIRTEFTIYKAGSNELVTKAPISADWMVFDLAPGRYDALATDMTGTPDNRPMIWIRDIKVEDGKTVSHEAIFTAGKLKVIGRGPNNRIITCHFKVFRYGSDRELINGTTGDDWEIFEIEPGKYYVEAGYHDEEQSVTLKKWINVAIGENEIVELVLRF